jgi:hypothetical protein
VGQIVGLHSFGVTCPTLRKLIVEKSKVVSKKENITPKLRKT